MKQKTTGESLSHGCKYARDAMGLVELTTGHDLRWSPGHIVRVLHWELWHSKTNVMAYCTMT